MENRTNIDNSFNVSTNEHEQTSTSFVDDIIELNIGGQKLTTLRSTLTVIPNSKLARMFTDPDMEMHLIKDKHGAIFFDYNPIYFNYLLDQLRTMKHLTNRPTYSWQFQAPYVNSQVNFTHMLSDLGLTGQ
jgi:hypothetical protein